MISSNENTRSHEAELGLMANTCKLVRLAENEDALRRYTGTYSVATRPKRAFIPPGNEVSLRRIAFIQ